MNLTTEQIRELTAEFDALHEGRLDNERREQLDQMIAENSDVRKLYICYAGVCAGLVWDLCGPPDAACDQLPIATEGIEQDAAGRSVASIKPAESSESLVSPRSPSWLDRASRHPKLPAVAVAIFALSALLFGLSLLPLQGISEGGDDGHKAAEKPVANLHCAILNAEYGVKWVEGARTSARDPRLWAGERLVIEDGLIELKYVTGAQVVIEGPADFVVGVESDETEPSERTAEEGNSDVAVNSGFLKVGKLRARVDNEEAKNFTIATPITRVKDLGTEFAIDVGAEGETKLHVRDGEVLLGGTNGLAEVQVQKGGSFRVVVDASGNPSLSAVDSLEGHFKQVYAHRIKESTDGWVADHTVRPTWDTYVHRGPSGRNFGNEHELFVKNSAHLSDNREAWLEFDLAEIECDRVIEAELVLTVAQGKESSPGDSTTVAGWEFELVGMRADDVGIDDPETVTWESTRGHEGERIAVFRFASIRQVGRKVAATGSKLAEFVRSSKGSSVILVVKRLTPDDVSRFANSFASSERGGLGPVLRLRYSADSSE